MIPKPKQWGAEYASVFQDASVVGAYQYRPFYPPALFEMLVDLIPHTDAPRKVLDAGCGTGFVARTLVRYVDQVDAVDIAPAMIAAGKTLPGGDDLRLRWICGPIESVTLHPPYALIVAAASLHWMEWDIALPRFHSCLVPTGYLAIVEDLAEPNPWDAAIGAILSRYSMNRDFQPYTMLTVAEELAKRGLFERAGLRETEPVPFRQPIDEWVESFHARNGLSRDRMDPQAAGECDRQLKQAIARYCPEGIVEQRIAGRLIWGKPGTCHN